MASKTNTQRVALTFGLLLFIIATIIPQQVSAGSLREVSSIPDLDSFIQSVQNGDASTPLGVYAAGLFAFPIIQQPDQRYSYVSAQPNIVTEFGPASAYGNVGLLAHDFLAGQYFSQLLIGQNIQLIYGSGQVENFVITQIYQYQAT